MTRACCLSLLLYASLIFQARAQTKIDTLDNKKVRFSPLPVVYYSPETKLGFGALLAANFKINNDSQTKGSYVQTSFIYTVNKQFELSNKGRIYGHQNKNITEYKIYYSYFPEFFFGYQTEDPESFKEQIQYNRLLLEGRRFWKVNGNVYLGAFGRYQRIFNLAAPPGGNFETVAPPGYQGYYVAGIAPAFNYDSRDSQVYPTRGYYLEVLWMAYPGAVSDFTFGNFRLDGRLYKSPGLLKDDVIAIQIFMNLNQGTIPYKDMAEIGGPNTMRGYYRGYYRYESLYALQAEYRFMLTRHIGFAGWAGLASTTEDWKEPFAHPIRPNAGLGLRVRINQHDKLNVRADFGVGRNQTGFYLDIAEAY